MRPAWRPGAGSPVRSSPGSKASAARSAASESTAASSRSGVSGALGVSKLISVAIVGGRPEPARRQLRHTTHGQHCLTEEADPTQRARASGEPPADQHGEDPFSPPRERRRGGRRRARSQSEHRNLVSRIDKAVQKGAMHQNTGARKKSKAARIVATGSRSSQARSTGRASHCEAERQRVAVVGPPAAPDL